jgi:hypothetical protein
VTNSIQYHQYLPLWHYYSTNMHQSPTRKRYPYYKPMCNAPFATDSLKTRCINLSSFLTSILVVINFIALSKSASFKRSMLPLPHRGRYQPTHSTMLEQLHGANSGHSWKSLGRPIFVVECGTGGSS